MAGFHLVPYFPRTKADVRIGSGVLDEDDTTREDPADVRFLESLSTDDRTYTSEDVQGL